MLRLEWGDRRREIRLPIKVANGVQAIISGNLYRIEDTFTLSFESRSKKTPTLCEDLPRQKFMKACETYLEDTSPQLQTVEMMNKNLCLFTPKYVVMNSLVIERETILEIFTKLSSWFRHLKINAMGEFAYLLTMKNSHPDLIFSRLEGSYVDVHAFFTYFMVMLTFKNYLHLTNTTGAACSYLNWTAIRWSVLKWKLTRGEYSLDNDIQLAFHAATREQMLLCQQATSSSFDLQPDCTTMFASKLFFETAVTREVKELLTWLTDHNPCDDNLLQHVVKNVPCCDTSCSKRKTGLTQLHNGKKIGLLDIFPPLLPHSFQPDLHNVSGVQLTEDDMMDILVGNFDKLRKTKSLDLPHPTYVIKDHLDAPIRSNAFTIEINLFDCTWFFYAIRLLGSTIYTSHILGTAFLLPQIRSHLGKLPVAQTTCDCITSEIVRFTWERNHSLEFSAAEAIRKYFASCTTHPTRSLENWASAFLPRVVVDKHFDQYETFPLSKFV